MGLVLHNLDFRSRLKSWKSPFLCSPLFWQRRLPVCYRVSRPVLGSNGNKIDTGLWGYVSCDWGSSDSSPGSHCSQLYSWNSTSCQFSSSFGSNDCQNYANVGKIAAGGIISNAAVAFLFFVFCIGKLTERARKMAETGLIGHIVRILPLFGSIVGAVCWGVYYQKLPYRGNNGFIMGPAFWIALGGWLASALSVIPRFVWHLTRH